MRRIPYVNLAAQFAEERPALLALSEKVYAGGYWVGGPEVKIFEDAVAKYLGMEHAVALSSGTDALILGLRALDIGPGDEVITPPNSFVSSTAAIALLGATPVFADVLIDQNLDPRMVEAAITPRTRAIMPVHLTGRVAAMDRIGEIAGNHGLAVIEDAAQSIGSTFNGKKGGTFGDIGCFSAHPMKNLNAAGDAGFAVTDNAELAERLRRLRNNGIDRNMVVEWGWVARMDSLQAAILSHRLGKLNEVIARRRDNAALYREQLDPAHVFIAPERMSEFNTYHTFVVQVDRRDSLVAHLANKGIDTAVHYPVPLHLQPAARNLGYKPGDFPMAEAQAGRILSLPINQFLSAGDIRYVADALNGFYR
jgi:dTDP-4-amino-4,6-dideoxygalactose transaminase